MLAMIPVKSNIVELTDVPDFGERLQDYCSGAASETAEGGDSERCRASDDNGGDEGEGNEEGGEDDESDGGNGEDDEDEERDGVNRDSGEDRDEDDRDDGDNGDDGGADDDNYGEHLKNYGRQSDEDEEGDDDKGEITVPKKRRRHGSDNGDTTKKWNSGNAQDETRRALNTTLEEYPASGDDTSQNGSKTLHGSQAEEIIAVHKSSSSVINVGHLPCFVDDAYLCTEFEHVYEPDVQFPPLPTSDQMPFLDVLKVLGRGRTGAVCKARLRNPAMGANSLYAMKFVDAQWRFDRESRHCCEELRDEYVNYCLLELGRQDDEFAGIIKKFTPSCYGLYRCKDRSEDKFLLITEYAGKAIPDDWNDMSSGLRLSVMESLLCLHSIGLCHADPEGRNIIRKDGSSRLKFVDFCESYWHKCPGIRKCEELFYRWRYYFPKKSGNKFQLRVCSKYNLRFGRNLREHLQQTRGIEPEKLGGCLREFVSNADER